MSGRSTLLKKKAAPIHAEAQDRVFYHGTSTEAAAQAILSSGIQPREITMPSKAKSKSQLAPAQGRVYITEDLGYAAIYALGGSMFGNGESTIKWVERSDPYGYIFELRGDDLSGDVVPDEDSIGETLTHLLSYRRAHARQQEIARGAKPRWDGELSSLESTMKFNYGPINQTGRAPESVRNELLWAAERVMTDKQRQDILTGFIGAQAAVGKKVQKLISPQTTQWLLDNGAHAAHLGAVYPRKAWRFKKADAANIQKEQVLSICEEIPLPQRKAASMKTGDWRKAEEIRRGDVMAFPAPVFTVRNVYREGDEIIVLGGPGVIRRFDPQDEVNTLRKEFRRTAAVGTDVTEIPAFKAWFAGSKVVDAHGQPLVVFHGTPRDFAKDEFQVGAGGRGSTESFGFHFGPHEAANSRIMPTIEQKPWELNQYRWHIMPVYLAIKHPLRMQDIGDWQNLQRLGRWLVKAGIDSAQIDEALAKSKHTARIRALTKVVQDAGYDGIVYHNEHEGGGDSWIALDPRQIKSAIGNSGAFDPKSKSMTDHKNATITPQPTV